MAAFEVVLTLSMESKLKEQKILRSMKFTHKQRCFRAWASVCKKAQYEREVELYEREQ